VTTRASSLSAHFPWAMITPEVLPPGEHERIRAIQKPPDFPLSVYGFDRDEPDMVKITRRLSAPLAAHLGDRPLR
jgi:hypothetical protein